MKISEIEKLEANRRFASKEIDFETELPEYLEYSTGKETSLSESGETIELDEKLLSKIDEIEPAKKNSNFSNNITEDKYLDFPSNKDELINKKQIKKNNRKIKS